MQKSNIKHSVNRHGLLSYHPHHVLFFIDIGFLLVSAFALLKVFEIPGGVLYGLAMVLVICAYSVFSFANGLYDWHRFRRHLKRPVAVFGGIIFAFGSLLLCAFAFKVTSGFSRLWIGSWFVSVAVYILISRVVLTWYLSSPSFNGFPRRRALIIGAGQHGRKVLDHLRKFDDQSLEVIGFLDDQSDRLTEDDCNVPVLGSTDLAVHLAQQHGVEIILFALPWPTQARIDHCVRQLTACAVDFYVAPDPLWLDYADRPVFRLGGMPVMSLMDRPISEWNGVLKRIEDLCLAIPALILLSPLMAIVALAIKLESRGPVFFIQDRYGFNNNLIKVYKFRSMYTETTDHHCERQTVKNDPRVTRIGRFIRYTSIDELPQLLNVIQGCMSLVGPRPHAKGTKSEGRLLEDAVNEYASRHRVKPGITGWAQCNGWRGETDTHEKIVKRVEHDLFYIENWSIFLDLLIIAKTLLLLFKKQDNAY